MTPAELTERLRGRHVVVTGADGFIGSHVVEALVAASATVTALAAYNSFDAAGWLDDLDPAVRARIRIVRGDIRDGGFVMRLLEGQHICLHLAALIAIPFSYDAPRAYVDTNVVGTLNMLEAARHHKLARIVNTSTSEVYGTALTTPMDEGHPLQGQSPYSATKIAADMLTESFARSFDLPAVTLRPFNTFGPRQSERAVISSTIRQALDPACSQIRLGDLSTKRDFTFVKDTARAFLTVAAAEALDHGTAYNGGTGRAVTIGEMVDNVIAITGCNKPIITDHERLRPGKSEVLTLLADHGRLTNATGWRPETSLEAGLTETVAWWRKRIAGGQVRRDAGYML
jgi:NAD dependent epimerase/dehydratase